MSSLYLYRWVAQTLQGATITGEVVSQSYQQAQQYLLEQEKFPLKIEQITKFDCKNNDLFLVHFTRQLANLLHVGITLQETLSLLIKTQKNRARKYLIQQIALEINQGVSLSKALRRHGNIFDSLYCLFIHVGEMTGELEQSCLQLAIQLERQLFFKKQFKRIMVYPSITFFSITIVTVLIFIFVIPLFDEFYGNFNNNLPVLTKIVLNMSCVIKRYVILLSIIILLLTILYAFVRNIPDWRKKEQGIILKLPIIGNLLQQICLARLSRTLAITLNAGLSLLDSLEISGKSTTNIVYQVAMLEVMHDVQKGISLGVAMGQQPIFPSLLKQIIALGEATGSLNTMLRHSADHYEKQLEENIEIFIKILEPTIIILISVITGFLIIAIYLPVFQLGQAINY